MPEIKLATSSLLTSDLILTMKVSGFCVWAHLCTVRRCRSSLRWSSRRCSPDRTPLRNRGYSCTSHFLRAYHRRRTFHFRDKVCQSPPHRLGWRKSEESVTSHLVIGFLAIFLLLLFFFATITEQMLPLQSGPNVPFGQHTLMVSTQNHLCKSGCFVFLQCIKKQNRDID